MGLTFWVFSPKKLHRRLVTWFQMRIWLRGTVRGCWGVVGGGCKCMELVAAGWCTRKWKGLDQTIRILTSGDLGVIRLGSIHLCVWHKSRELRGRGSPGFPTPMIESFSAELLPAIKGYWVESHLELLILLLLNSRAREEHLTHLLTTLRNYVERL